jgi:hypothetical protein
MTPIRIPLSDQIAEAERWRDKAQELAKTNPAILPRLHATEAIVLTLNVYQAYAVEIREYRKAKGQTE